jgi:hypothetical protein
VNCICGCGTRLGRDQVDLNLLAGELAIELVVWDKARSLRSPLAAAEVEAVLADGAPRYQALLAAIHAGERPGEGELEAGRSWLGRSQEARRQLAEQLPVLPKRRIKLSDADQERVDRRHPERTFSGGEEEQGRDQELEAVLLTALEDVRLGRAEEAERALRRFLSERG